jgi:hypothetical protein
VHVNAALLLSVIVQVRHGGNVDDCSIRFLRESFCKQRFTRAHSAGDQFQVRQIIRRHGLLNAFLLHQSQHCATINEDTLSAARMEIYQSFMVGYVRRINEATLNVTIGGVRIGNAKYSRLAQINLRSRIITFSRFAIENVPERGRRLLVIHELAHVKEPGHGKRFWDLVAKYEPDYKAIDKELMQAFNANVRQAELAGAIQEGSIAYLTGSQDKLGCGGDLDELVEDEDGAWLGAAPGIMCGGS